MKIDDKVKFIKTGSDIMDGKTGVIIGVYATDIYSTHFIVGLDELLKDRPDKAVVITQHCLELN